MEQNQDVKLGNLPGSQDKFYLTLQNLSILSEEVNIYVNKNRFNSQNPNSVHGILTDVRSLKNKLTSLLWKFNTRMITEATQNLIFIR